MPDFSKHSDVLVMIKASQDSDKDMRDAAREAHLFIDKRDGQWEPYWWNANSKKPRYTFDMTGPIVDQIAGEMEQADFDITIKPAGGDITKDDAQLLDGLIRNIENMSSAVDIFNMAGRNMVTAGIDGWQVKQKFVDDDSFEQDLIIEHIDNFIDSVWFGPFKKPDASDARWCMVQEAVPKIEYDERFPEGSGESLGSNRQGDAYFQKPDSVVIGQLYYIEEIDREILLMSNGMVLDNNEENRSILDELEAGGITVTNRRKRKKQIVKSRLLDGGGWLNGEQETVFSQIPVIPTIGNFKYFENKVIYRGVVEKLLDAQRVFNYSKSREIEEGALAPRAKYWMPQDQAAGFEDTLQTLNTNSDPVQFYNADKFPNPPQQIGGAQINPGLKTLSDDMRAINQQTAGLFAANMGENPGLQSGVAIDKLQRKGDTGTIKYFKAQERAICRTARILVDAIPKVYDTERKIRILKEDGSFDLSIVNQTVLDQQSGQPVLINDLSKGKYDVSCSAGPSFQNKQQETVAAITEIAAVNPGVLQIASDVMLNNITAPGMDLIAERMRHQLFNAGMIPFSQMTEEEKQQVIQAQQLAAQHQQSDPTEIIAQAEAERANAETQKVLVDASVAQRREDREDFKAQQQAQQAETKAAQEQVKISQKQEEIDLNQLIEVQKQQMQQQQMQMQQQSQQIQLLIEQQTALVNNLNTQAKTATEIRQGAGVDTIVGPGVPEAFIKQNRIIQESQDEQGAHDLTDDL